MSKRRRERSRKARQDTTETGARPGTPPAEGAARERGPEPGVPLWIPAAVFVALTVFLFRDFIFSDRMLFGNDTLGLGYVVRAWYADALHALGRIPGWMPPILGGTPFLEALSAGDSLYPPSLLLLLVLEPYRALGWKLVLHVAVAGFLMFAWIRTLGRSRAAALVAGTGYMLAPVFVSLVHPGHDGKMFVTALAPLVFLSVERFLGRPGVRSFSLIAVSVALVILTTHFQMAYFLFGAVGLYAIFRTVELARGGGPDAAAPATPGTALTARAPLRFVLFLAASVAGAGLAAVQFIPALEYVTDASRRIQTTREAAGEVGVQWSSSWSMHPEEAMALLIPEFAGNHARAWPWGRGSYWGRNAFKDNHEYAGLVLLLLAALSFAGGARSALRWFFGGLALLALLFAQGAHTPVWRVMYEVVPGIRLFRAPSQVMFLFAFSAATLAAFGVDRLLALGPRRGAPEGRGGGAGTPERRRALQVLAAGVGVMALLAMLASSGMLHSLWTSVVWPDMDPGRRQVFEAIAPYITRGAWIGLLLTGAVAAAAAAHLRGMIPAGALVAALVILVTVDEARVDRAFITTFDFSSWAAPDRNVQAILQREAGSDEPFRLLSMRGRGQDIMPVLHGIELAAGHHPNDLARYRELIGMVGSSEPWNLYRSAAIRRLLNVRYILWPDRELGQVYGGGGIVQRLELEGQPYETLIAEAGLPRARLVGSWVVKRDDEAVPYMLSDAFDPQREVVLAEEPPLERSDAPVDGEVRWLLREPDRMRLAVRAQRPALLVIAENWYKGWRATVDGEPAPVLRAYHTLRAVPVPAGTSEVELRYAPDTVRRSLWLSVLVLTGLALANGWVGWRARRAGGLES